MSHLPKIFNRGGKTPARLTRISTGLDDAQLRPLNCLQQVTTSVSQKQRKKRRWKARKSKERRRREKRRTKRRGGT